MRFLLVSLLFLTISSIDDSSRLCAQDYSKVDAHARSIPVPGKPDIKKLAEALATGCLNEKEKARSFFVWMSDHIHYDIKMRENTSELPPEKRQALQAPEKVIKRGKAVCEGYTNLYIALCKGVGIRALEVNGIAKNQRGEMSGKGHSWCIIHTDGQWGLVDPTWGAGVVDTDEGKYHEQLNDQFFLATAETLVENHYPNDPLFQCLAIPINLAEFKLPVTKLKDILLQKKGGSPTPGFEYIQDSLNAINALTSGQYLRSAGQRSLSINPKSSFGPWAIGEYYYQRSLVPRATYIQAIKDLKPQGFYPPVEWFDAQMPTLKNWESLALSCLDAVKTANLQDNYSKQVQNLRQNAQSSLTSCRSIIKENPRLKAAVKRGVKVKMTSE